MNNDTISKKEFLKLTGISYGQLYRWKRVNLIPEGWFMKKSSFTGQETYFPKEKILNRVKLIQELKDKYSLEEIAAILSPELSKRTFSENDIYRIPGIDGEIIEFFQKHLKHDYLKFNELLFAYILCKAKNEFKIGRNSIKDMVQSACKWLKNLKGIEYSLLVCNQDSNIFMLLIEQNASFFIDNTIKVLMKFQLDAISEELGRHLAAIIDDY